MSEGIISLTSIKEAFLGHPMTSFFMNKDLFLAKARKTTYRFFGEATIPISFRFSDEATRPRWKFKLKI